MTFRARRTARSAARAIAVIGLLTGVAIAAPAPAASKTSFDGMWSVLIVTEKGDCDRGYRYAIRITNGVVGYAGEASFHVSGRVGPNGAVTVRVSRGDRLANGFGRLAATTGVGVWSGGACAGTWSAERRS